MASTLKQRPAASGPLRLLHALARLGLSRAALPVAAALVRQLDDDARRQREQRTDTCGEGAD